MIGSEKFSEGCAAVLDHFNSDAMIPRTDGLALVCPHGTAAMEVSPEAGAAFTIVGGRVCVFPYGTSFHARVPPHTEATIVFIPRASVHAACESFGLKAEYFQEDLAAPRLLPRTIWVTELVH